MGKRLKDPIPARPFQELIEERVAYYNRLTGDSYAYRRVAQDFGWDHLKDGGEKRLFRFRYGFLDSKRDVKNGVGGERYRYQTEVYARATVEDALHHAGIQFEDVYPHRLYPALYEDIPLEDEMWCAGCQDHCTPIHGTCPWCEGTLLVPLTASDILSIDRRAA